MKTISGGDIRLILLMAGLVALLFVKGVPLSVPPFEADAQGFDAVRAIERLARILGDERPHPADSVANDAVRERLIAEIEALGFTPETRDDFTCNKLAKWNRTVCARVRNVVFRAGPEISEATGKAVMVASHYDSVAAGPGAADDGLGVAVSLELAAELAAAPPQKPVVFLLTDGEELGLLGAHSFALNDPLAEKIGSVINIEARGVRGPGLMFETSVPNGRDVFSYVKGARRPFANSLMTDIYRLLPNDTDMSEFLPKGYDGVNLALTEGVEFYHTPHDRLANLDPRSVRHVGRGARRSLRNLLQSEADGPEGQYAFVDILSRFSVIAPQWLSAPVLAIGIFVAGFAFASVAGGKPIRAAMAAPAIVAAAGAATFALQWMIGALRPEAFYWAAHPQALRAVCYLCAVAAAIAGLKFVAAGAAPARLYHAGWLWFSLLGAALFLIVPGGAILFALPVLFYTAGAVMGARARAWNAWAPIVLLIAIFAPALHFAEIGLGFASAPVFTVVAALLAMTIAPLALGEETRVGAAPLAAAALALALAVGAALVVPAYSAAKPVPMNIDYFIDAETRAAQWLIASPENQAPDAMRAVAPFAPVDIEGLGEAMPAAQAPFLETSAPEALVLADDFDGAERHVRIALIANGADAMYLQIPEDAEATGLSSGRIEADFGEAGEQRLYCVGRACDQVVFDIRLNSIAPADWHLFGIRYGLPRAAEPIVEARPEWATPIQSGDVSIIRKKIKM